MNILTVKVKVCCLALVVCAVYSRHQCHGYASFGNVKELSRTAYGFRSIMDVAATTDENVLNIIAQYRNWGS